MKRYQSTAALKSRLQDIFPPTAETQIAEVRAIDYRAGQIRLGFISTDNMQFGEFLVPISAPYIGKGHFFGGQYSVGDLVLVNVVKRDGKNTSYRIISQSIGVNTGADFGLGRIPILFDGEKYIKSKSGAETFWNKNGDILNSSGFATPIGTSLRDEIESASITYNPNVRTAKDYYDLLANERTFNSFVSSTQVQWGRQNRITDITGIRTIENFNDQDEFRISVYDGERRLPKLLLQLGQAPDDFGSYVSSRETARSSVFGVFYRDKNADFVLDELGGFTLENETGALTHTKDGISLRTTEAITLNTESNLTLSAIGMLTETSRSKEEAHSNYSLHVDENYSESIAALHKISRTGLFEDNALVNPTSTVGFSWSITPSTVANLKISVDKIFMGQSGTTIAPLEMVTDKTSIGSDLSEAKMEVSATETKFGVGRIVNISFGAESNSIGHQVANVINAPTNFMGTDLGNVSQPAILGTNLLTEILSPLLTQITSLTSAITELATSYGAHIHPVTGVNTTPSVEGAVVAGIVIGEIAGITAEIATTVAALPATISARVFLG